METSSTLQQGNQKILVSPLMRDCGVKVAVWKKGVLALAAGCPWARTWNTLDQTTAAILLLLLLLVVVVVAVVVHVP
jgi:hypothetical protein